MAARRLVIAMFILLAISTLAAALLPAPDDEEPVGDPAPTVPAPERGVLVEASVDAAAERAETISARVGDQISITVETEVAGEVEIAAIGELRFASPLEPARFDLLASEAGSHPIRLVEADRVIATIEIAPRDPAEHAAERLPASGEGTEGP